MCWYIWSIWKKRSAGVSPTLSLQLFQDAEDRSAMKWYGVIRFDLICLDMAWYDRMLEYVLDVLDSAMSGTHVTLPISLATRLVVISSLNWTKWCSVDKRLTSMSVVYSCFNCDTTQTKPRITITIFYNMLFIQFIDAEKYSAITTISPDFTKPPFPGTIPKQSSFSEGGIDSFTKIIYTMIY